MKTRDLVFIALFAAIIVVLGLLPKIELAIVPVPITAQTLGVMLAGAILGPKRGALSVALVVLLVIIGLPVLAGGRGGLGILAGPSGGFILGWIFGAFLTGYIVQMFADISKRDLKTHATLFLACIAGGIVVVYVFGIIWLAKDLDGGLTQAFVGSLIFIPGDLIKAIFATLITIGVRRAYQIDLK